MKIRLLFLSWLTSVLMLLGSSLEIRAESLGLDFDLSQRDVATEERVASSTASWPAPSSHSTSNLNAERIHGISISETPIEPEQDRTSNLSAESSSRPAPSPNRDNGMLDFSISGDKISTPAVDAAVVPIGSIERLSAASSTTAEPVQRIEQSAVVALRRAIVGQESGGQFDIVNPHSGALGYAQLMPANVKAWGRQALGYAPSKREFLSKTELQLQIIDHKLRQYWQQELKTTGGDEQEAVLRVASRWYSGNANLYTSTRPQYYRAKNGKHYRYPSISSYSWSVWRKYQKQASR